MKVASLLFFETSTAILAVAGFTYGLPELAIAGLGLGGVALAAVVFYKTTLVNAMLALYSIVACVFGLFHMSPLFCAGALAAALIGWDAGLLVPLVSSASPAERLRFAIGYTVRAAVLAGIGVLLVAGARMVRVPLTFGSGVGLSLVVFLLAAFFLRTLRHVLPERGPSSGDRPPAALNETGGGRISRRPPR